MSIHVIHAALGVVLDDEDRGTGPVRTVADGIHETANRQVVIRNLCGWRGNPTLVPLV